MSAARSPAVVREVRSERLAVRRQRGPRGPRCGGSRSSRTSGFSTSTRPRLVRLHTATPDEPGEHFGERGTPTGRRVSGGQPGKNRDGARVAVPHMVTVRAAERVQRRGAHRRAPWPRLVGEPAGQHGAGAAFNDVEQPRGPARGRSAIPVAYVVERVAFAPR